MVDVVQSIEQTIVQEGRYRGWPAGSYELLNEEFGFLTELESRNYSEAKQAWEKGRAQLHSEGKQITSFVSLDGIRYGLPDGLHGVLDEYDFVRVLYLAFGQGDIDFDDVAFVYAHFPFTDATPTKWLLNSDGSVERERKKRVRGEPYAGYEIKVIHPLFTKEQELQLKQKRQELLLRMLKKWPLRWGSPDVVDLYKTKEKIAQAGLCRGWPVGGYYAPKSRPNELMTRTESDAYWDSFNEWKQALKEKREREEHDTTYFGIDGVERPLPPGLEGVLEEEACIREAVKRYREGSVN